jgi:hypothetical protein
MYSVERQLIFRRLLKSKILLASSLVLVSGLPYFSTMKKEAIYSSETSTDFQQTTQLYVAEDRILHNRYSEKLKPHLLWTSCRLRA